MKAVFIYDHDFLTRGEAVYSSGAFNADSWNRYLTHFESLTVVGQKADTALEVKRLNSVNHQKVNFRFLPGIKSLTAFVRNLFLNDKELESIISNHHTVIVRMYSEWAFQAIRIAKKLGKPYAIELVGCPWDAYRAHHSLKAKLMAPFSYFRLKKAIAESKFVLYVTDEFLQNRYPTSGNQIGASNVMLLEPSQTILKNRFRKIKALIAAKSTMQIGVIGKIDVKAKGMGVLIKALGLLKINFKLHIVGPGDQDFLQPIIEKYKLETSVIFHGKLMAGEKINDFLDSLDLYIHPSMQEGLPRSVIEAMARACPILASSIAGTPELIDKPYLHQPGQYLPLSNQIEELFLNPTKLSEMARENFENAKKFYPVNLNEKRSQFWGGFARYCKFKVH